MNNQIKELVSGIMELAYELNYSQTNQDKTENKPTVFVWFSGHVCELEVQIYKQGWIEFSDNYESYLVYLDEQNTEITIEKLIEIGCELRDLVEEWC